MEDPHTLTQPFICGTLKEALEEALIFGTVTVFRWNQELAQRSDGQILEFASEGQVKHATPHEYGAAVLLVQGGKHFCGGNGWFPPQPGQTAGS